MLYFRNNTYHFYQIVASYTAHGTPKQTYTNDRAWWEAFVAKWWHHDSLAFKAVVPTDEQKQRLAEINALPGNNKDIHPAEYAAYVEHGIALPTAQAPGMADIAQTPEVTAHTLAYYKAQIGDNVRALRKEKEEGGTSFEYGGQQLFIRTDNITQAKIAGAIKFLEANEDYPHIDWELKPWAWTTVDLTQLTYLGRVIGVHVQACFSRSKQLQDEIAAAETLAALFAINIDAGWPS